MLNEYSSAHEAEYSKASANGGLPVSPDTAGCPPRAAAETASCCHHFIVMDRDLTCNRLPLDLSIFYLDSVFNALFQWCLDVERLFSAIKCKLSNNLNSFHCRVCALRSLPSNWKIGGKDLENWNKSGIASGQAQWVQSVPTESWQGPSPLPCSIYSTATDPFSICQGQSVAFLHVKPQVSYIVFDLSSLLRLFIGKLQ